MISTSQLVAMVLAVTWCCCYAQAESCQQGVNCRLPGCFCPVFQHPLAARDIPQIVYFGFDDAVQPVVSAWYDQLFTTNRRNPNGCPITMSLYVSHNDTQYWRVQAYHRAGHEIGVHSVVHGHIKTKDALQSEATQQRNYLHTKANIPANELVGWRSPFLETAGDQQPALLQRLGYQYDISLPYSHDDQITWPFTLDFGFPYPCNIPPCPRSTSSHKGFWEVMVNSVMDVRTGRPCGAYVDSCLPESEDEAVEYLWKNFLRSYTTTRAPFGLNMHASWFSHPEYLSAMDKFLDKLLARPDVYIVSVRQMLDWMKTPVKLSQINTFSPWTCGNQNQNHSQQITIKPTNTPSNQTNYSFLPKSTTLKAIVTTDLTTQPIKTTLQTQETKTLPTLQSKNTTYHPTETTTQHHKTTAKPTQTTLRPTAILPSWPDRNDIDGARCVQNVNCHMPSCFCRSSTPPFNNMAKQNTPQLVYIAIDTKIDNDTILPLLKIFSGHRKNSNGCQVSGTVFTPSVGNDPTFVKTLQSQGAHIAGRGGNIHDSYSGSILRSKVSEQLAVLRSSLSPSASGWRGLASMSPTDDVLQALVDLNVTYDSSVVSDQQTHVWPYTLDFGLGDKCSINENSCPKGRYPGLWEVPIKPLQLPKKYQGQSGGYECFFLDYCPGMADSHENIKELLDWNFRKHYDGHRTPFGINLRESWFVKRSNKESSLQGLTDFLDGVLSHDDVIILSIEQMLYWMKTSSQPLVSMGC